MVACAAHAAISAQAAFHRPLSHLALDPAQKYCEWRRTQAIYGALLPRFKSLRDGIARGAGQSERQSGGPWALLSGKRLFKSPVRKDPRPRSTPP